MSVADNSARSGGRQSTSSSVSRLTTRLDRLWDDYRDKAALAQATGEFEAMLAAGHAWGALMREFEPKAPYP